MKVILSIKPKFAEAILRGEKKFEYRKIIFKRDVSTVLIYESSPTCRFVGEFEIEDIMADVPSTIWSKTCNGSGIDKEFFDSYFNGKKIAYAIKVGKVIKYDELKTFNSICPAQRPPQNFMYLNCK